MLKILSTIWEAWKTFANGVLEWIFRLLLFAFYFSIFVPFALLFKVSDKDSFKIGWHGSEPSQGEDLY